MRLQKRRMVSTPSIEACLGQDAVFLPAFSSPEPVLSPTLYTIFEPVRAHWPPASSSSCAINPRFTPDFLRPILEAWCHAHSTQRFSSKGRHAAPVPRSDPQAMARIPRGHPARQRYLLLFSGSPPPPFVAASRVSDRPRHACGLLRLCRGLRPDRACQENLSGRALAISTAGIARKDRRRRLFAVYRAAKSRPCNPNEPLPSR